MVEYCPHCDNDTVHKFVEDEYFEKGIECTVCNTVYEIDSQVFDKIENFIPENEGELK